MVYSLYKIVENIISGYIVYANFCLMIFIDIISVHRPWLAKSPLYGEDVK